MTLVHGLIARRILATAAAVFGFLVVIAVTTQVLNQVFRIIDAAAGVWVAAQMSVLVFPRVAAVTLPIAWLVALVQAFDSLRDNSESVVLLGTGSSPLYLMRPALLLTGVVALLMLITNLFVEPLTNRSMRALIHELRYEAVSIVTRDTVLREVEPGLFVRRGPQGDDGAIHGFLILDRRDAPAETLYLAETVRLVRDEDGLPLVEMSNGRLHVRDYTGEESYVARFQRYHSSPEAFFSELPGGFQAYETPTAELARDLLAGNGGHAARSELLRRLSDWLYPLVYCAVAAWVSIRADARAADRRGRFRWTMVQALALGAGVRVAGLVALGHSGAGVLATALVFAVPLTASAVFAALAVVAARDQHARHLTAIEPA